MNGRNKQTIKQTLFMFATSRFPELGITRARWIPDPLFAGIGTLFVWLDLTVFSVFQTSCLAYSIIISHASSAYPTRWLGFLVFQAILETSLPVLSTQHNTMIVLGRTQEPR